MSTYLFRMPAVHRLNGKPDIPEALAAFLATHDLDPDVTPSQEPVVIDSDAGTLTIYLFQVDETGARVPDNRPGRHGYRKHQVVRTLTLDPLVAGLVYVGGPEGKPWQPVGPDAPTVTAPPPKSTKGRGAARSADSSRTSNADQTATLTPPQGTAHSDPQS